MPRLNIEYEADGDVDELFQVVQSEDGVPPHDVLRCGLSVLKAYQWAKRFGFPHLGFTSDPKNLDVEMTGVL